jgi:hypothetical protein
MSTLPSEPLAGARALGEIRLYSAAFDPCFDLLVDGDILATLFYDEKPEVAYSSVDVEGADGVIRRVPGAEAGLDENEVGWCLQFTDEGPFVTVISQAPAGWIDHALGAAWKALAERVVERGLWKPAAGFRLWDDGGHDEGIDPDTEIDW